MALSKDDVLNAIAEMSVMDIVELISAMEEKFGVTAAVAAAPAAAVEEGPSTKTVVLKDAGAAKIGVIKVIREITGLGLVEAKGVADKGGNIKENVSADEANEIKAKLEEAGATVELV